jgi:polyphosphate kinase 2 (PPK2 family)
MLVDSGIKIIKFYFSVSKDIQAERFEARKYNPLKQYKLSPIDQLSQQLWKKYTLAEYNNFSSTHTKESPWILINSDNKKEARINAIKYVLNQYDYPEKIKKSELKIDKDLLISGKEKIKLLKEEIDEKDDLFE